MNAIIQFKNISEDKIGILKLIFEEIKTGKNNQAIDSLKIREILGIVYKTKFWHPTAEELKKWEIQWFSTPVEKRWKKKSLKRPWDFLSWIESLQNAEVTLKKIEMEKSGEGNILLIQNSSPSGGIDSLEELIKIFDGKIITNTMV